MIILLIASLVGCATSGGKRRGSLREGVEKASDDHDGDRRVHTSYDWDNDDEDDDDTGFFFNDDDDDDDDDISYNRGDDEEVTFFDKDVKDKSSYFELKAGTGLLANKHFYAINGVTAERGWKISDDTKFGFFLGVEHAPVKQTDEFNSSLRDGTTIGSFGFSYKHLTSPHYTLLGNYLSFGMSMDIMGWSYKNPLTAWDDYGNEELIYNDMLKGYEIFVGTGLNLFNPNKVKLGTEVSAGIIFWDWRTLEGFDNDLFNPFLYVKFRVLLGIGE